MQRSNAKLSINTANKAFPSRGDSRDFEVKQCGPSSCPAPSERYPQVREEIETQDKLIAVLHEQLSMLGQRIQPVLRSTDLCASSPCEPERSLCEVAGRLASSNHGLRVAISRIGEMLEAVEL